MTSKMKTKKTLARREAADETTSSERLTALAEESAALARRLIPLTQVALDVVWRLPGGPGRVDLRG